MKIQPEKERHDNPLFSPGKDYQNNACVNFTPDSSWAIITGYKEAADLLAQSVEDTHQNQDILVYPIAFLYRQYIELQLKDVIRESRILLGKGNSFPKHHRLDDLWNAAKQLMIQIVESVDPTAGDYITRQDLSEIDQVIVNFNEIDPDSFAFRYPENKNGKKTLQGLTIIDIQNLKGHINVLSNRLEKFGLVVSLLKEWRSEISE